MKSQRRAVATQRQTGINESQESTKRLIVNVWRSFLPSVHRVNAKDYTEEQLDAWTNGAVDLKKWDESFLMHHTIVAIKNDEIVDFGDIDDAGYLDRLFVHQDHQEEGIASMICDELEHSVRGMKVTTHSSITDRSFFE